MPGSEGRVCGTPGENERVPVIPDRDSFLWWRHGDSNPEPPACKAGALPIAPCPHKKQPIHPTAERAPALTGSVRRLRASQPYRLPGSRPSSGLRIPAPSGKAGRLRSQLQQSATSSHAPRSGPCGPLPWNRAGSVGVPGLEPGTSSLSAKRSNRLSYTPRCLIGPRYDSTAHPGPISNRGIPSWFSAGFPRISRDFASRR